MLRDTRAQAAQRGRMTFIVGRRKVGKTRLIREAFSPDDLVYFFVAKKSEALLCEEYCTIIQDSLGAKIIGNLSTFSQVFEYQLELSAGRSFTLAIDEFQEFVTINPSVYSEIQHLWDTYKERLPPSALIHQDNYSQ